VFVAAFAMSAHVSASGFYINLQSVRGHGRVDAGSSVAADELGTIFFNPAGLIQMIRDSPDPDGIRLSVAIPLIVPRIDLRNRSSRASTPATLGSSVPIGGADAHNPTGATLVPNLYVGKSVLGGRGAVGVGINAPFGLGTSFDADWHGRYDATDASLRTVNLSIVGAYRLDTHVSVGGGMDFQYARTSLSGAIPNPLVAGGPTPATDGYVETTGHDAVTPGYNAGFVYEITNETRVGLHYRSGMTHQINGNSEFRALQGPLAALNGNVEATAELKLPAIATLGFRTRVAEPLVLLGDVQWFNWSAFEEVRIRFADGRPDAVRPEHYRDTFGLAAGAEYTAGPKWTARGGLRYETTPTVDGFRDTTFPDSDRVWLGLGGTLGISDKFEVDLSFSHAFFSDASIAVTRTFFDNTPLLTTVNVDSDIDSVVDTIAIDFRFRF
jgi:long-chain fatty acid transport protein